MSSKINFRNIVAAHLATLKNFDSGRYRPADFILFFILPAVAAASALFFGAKPGGGLHTSLIIFAGLNGVALVGALSLLPNTASDAHSNACAQNGPFSGYTLGKRLHSYPRFAHTGEVAGPSARTVAGIASAGGALLVRTGPSLARRRLRARAAARTSLDLRPQPGA